MLIIVLALAMPATAAPQVTEYDTSAVGTMTWGIAAGPDGALWFTAQGADNIGRITTTGAVSVFNIPSGVPAFGHTGGITAGPDGALWFTSAGGRYVGRITTSGVITKFLTPASNMLGGITSGPDGALWFLETGSNKVGRITTDGTITEFGGVTPGAGLWDITSGPDGAIWFTENTVGKIGRITTAGAVNEMNLAADSGPRGITTGPDGAVWFVENKANKIGRISTTGQLSEFSLPSGSAPAGITARPDGNLWFTEAASAKIGCITTAGAITEYGGLTGGSVPTGIASGPDGAVWFTEYAGNKVGKMTGLPGPSPSPSPASNFDSYIVLQNPNAQPATVTLTYMMEGGATKQETVVAGPTSRKTVYVNDSVGLGKSFSTKVSADSPIMSERPMYFNYKGAWTGGHDVVGANSPQSAWYFAEGTCRPNFDPYICIQNPGDADATVTITYMKGDGGTPTEDLTVPAHARSTVRCADKLGQGDDAAHDFSSKVECTNGQKIIAERPMYFNYKGAWTGGHDVIGTPAPATAYYFAEGTCRPNFDPYICIQNPGDADATVTITYMKGDGGTPTEDLTVPAHARSTVRCADKLGQGDDAAHDFSSKVECTNGQKIIAERPMYFNYKGAWTGGHDVVGASATADTWYFAEGYTGN